MRTLRNLTLIIVLVGLAPVSARADGACRVAVDRIGDTSSLVGTAAPQAAGTGRSVDIAALDVAYSDTDLTATVSVVDLSADRDTANNSSSYNVSFMTSDDETIVLRAVNADGEWSYSGGWHAPDGYTEPAVTGTHDETSNTVSVSVALADIGGRPSTGVLTDFHVYAQEEIRAVALFGLHGGMRFDEAPEWSAPRARLPLDGPCPELGGIVDPSVRCVLTSDPEGDSNSLWREEESERAATDIREVSVGANASTLAFDIKLAALDAPPADPASQQFQVAWQVDGEQFYALAERSASRLSLAGSGPENSFVGDVVVDDANDVVHLYIPRASLGIEDGQVLEGIEASTHVARAGIGMSSDVAPDGWQSDLSWTMAPTCDGTVQLACPVATDLAGDAGPLPTIGNRHFPRNHGSLDLLATGAATDGDTLLVSARVEDLREDAPPGFDAIGWTMSWSAGRDVRWAVQAVRFSDGETIFAYDLVEGNRFATGPFFGGTATAGSLDLENGVVTIEVPRAAVDAPEDGAALTKFGATSWAMQTGNTIGFHAITDRTKMRAYRMGSRCGV